MKGLPTDHSELLTAIEDSTSPANSNKQTKIHGRHRVINVWKCFKKPPLLKRTVFGSHSFKQPEVSTVRHILQSPTAIQTHLPHRHNSLLHRTGLYNSSHVHGTVVEMDRVSFRRSVTFMKRDGMVAGCIFILLHSHRAYWKRLSNNSCQNDDKPQYHMYRHASPQRRYIVLAFHIQNVGKSMNITFMPARLPHRHHQLIWKSLLRFI
jgi:hypothetical protein